MQCELCKNVTSKHNIYICESGHTICVNCDDSLFSTHEEEIKKDVSCDVETDKVETGKNLAGGDYIKIKPNINDELKRKQDKEEADINPQITVSKTTEISVIYKNVGYDNNESSTKCSCGKIYVNDIVIEKLNIRPIICPVLHCEKTVTLDSILKHFSFDHSKIPTVPINARKTLKIYLKPYNLSKNSQCVAVINPVGINSKLLLMAAKVVHTHSEINEYKPLLENQSDSKLYSLIKCKEEAYRLKNGEIIESHEDILIWTCRLSDCKQVCSIKVKRDNILGYSYIGEGLNIQNDRQDPISVFKSPECLIIRHYSMPKLLDDKGQIHVYINIPK